MHGYAAWMSVNAHAWMSLMSYWDFNFRASPVSTGGEDKCFISAFDNHTPSYMNTFMCFSSIRREKKVLALPVPRFSFADQPFER